MTNITKVLIANRGEIATRIARAAAACDIESLAIYAREDELSLHTRHADQRVQLAEAADPISAYLNIDNIMAIAKEHGADAIHPGYGFLSENADLASACEAAGIAFVGPSAATLSLFGDKVRSKELAASHGIPTVPGRAISGVADAEAFILEKLSNYGR